MSEQGPLCVQLKERALELLDGRTSSAFMHYVDDYIAKGVLGDDPEDCIQGLRKAVRLFIDEDLAQELVRELRVIAENKSSHGP